MHRGDWVDPKLRRMRFDEWADAFEDGLVRLAPTTARRYRQLLPLQIRPWFGGRPIAGIDFQDVDSFIVELFRRGYSAKTVRDCVSVLSLVMKAALRTKVIREIPAAGHHVKVARQRGQALPLDQLHRLVEHTREDYRLAVMVGDQSSMKASSWSITMLMMAAFTSSPFSRRDSATLTRSRMIPSSVPGGIWIGSLNDPVRHRGSLRGRTAACQCFDVLSPITAQTASEPGGTDPTRGDGSVELADPKL
jgi:hypothetical protein